MNKSRGVKDRFPLAVGLIALAIATVVVVVLRDETSGDLLYLAAFLIGCLYKRPMLGLVAGGLIGGALFHFSLAAYIIHHLATHPAQ